MGSIRERVAARWLLKVCIGLQDQAASLLAIPALLRQQGRAGGMLKHLANSLIGLRGTFEIVFGPNLLLHFFTLYHVRISKR